MTTNPNTPAPDFEIRDHVLFAARSWPHVPRTRTDDICMIWNSGRICGQVVVPVSVGRETYEYTQDERDGLILAHLMQRHGWTRETIGDQ